jgi:hypothetical protein
MVAECMSLGFQNGESLLVLVGFFGTGSHSHHIV